MINRILIYTGFALISWIIFLLVIFISMEAIDYVMEQWRYYGK